MKKMLVTLIVALITLLALFAAGALYFNRQQSMDSGEFSSSGQLSDRDLKKLPKETKLLKVLACGVDYSEELTDVIMYIQYDPKENSARVLSIPRDTFIGNETYSTGKINQVYKSTHSMESLVSEVERRFGLPVDYYATITLDALASVVDQIGGVEVTIPMDLYDNGVKVFSEGQQVLDGQQALLYVRIRHAYVNADLGRIEAQHNFMLAAMRKVQSLGKMDLLRLVMDNYSEVKTDMPLNRIVSVAASAFTVEEENIEMFTVPGVGKMNDSYAVYEIDKDALAQILNENFYIDADGITAEDLDFPEVAYQPPARTKQETTEDEASVAEENMEKEPSSSSEEDEPLSEDRTNENENEEEDDGKPHARKRTDVSSRDWGSSEDDWRYAG